MKKLINKLITIFNKKYKVLLIIPILLLLLGIAQLLVQYFTTGSFIIKSVSLKGGISLTALVDNPNIIDIRNFIKEKFPDADFTIRLITEKGKATGFVLDISDVKEEELLNALKEKVKLEEGKYTIEETGSALGKSFFKEIIRAIIIAFIFMAIAIFIYFRTFVPSIAVILAAASDILVTMAIVNLLGVKLTTAGIAAYLMLIGYSVDTDVLLTTHLVKRREGSINERLLRAFKTGITMTLTTLAAVSVTFIFAKSIVLKQIALILLIGLAIDIINTWIQNAAILRWYIENKIK